MSNGYAAPVITGLAAAAVISIIVAVYAYQNFYEPYATVTITQLEPAFLPSPPSDMEYEKMPNSVYDESQKIRELFVEVDDKYRELLSDCPPQRPVYCDIAARTTSSTTVTSPELQSILKSKSLNFDEYPIGAEWISYVKRDCLVPQSIMQDCYYTIKITRMY